MTFSSQVPTFSTLGTKRSSPMCSMAMAGIFFFAIAIEHIGDDLFVPSVENVGCGKTRGRMLAVAHVDRLVGHERKSLAAPQLLDVPPQIKEHFVDLGDAFALQN